jgi:hypothetical protein
MWSYTKSGIYSMGFFPDSGAFKKKGLINGQALHDR